MYNVMWMIQMNNDVTVLYYIQPLLHIISKAYLNEYILINN